MIRSFLLIITGIVLFLFATTKLSTEIQTLFSSRIRKFIKFAVERPLYALVTGIGATILFQSSSATSLFTVGLVSAGLISFIQSLGIILGADIATTLTVQLLVWKVSSLSPLFMVAGAFIYFSARDSWKARGECLFYFGLIFFGFWLIGEGAGGLRDHHAIVRFLREFSHPLTGLLVGLLFTLIVHASAIPIATLTILAQQDLMTIEQALPVVIGANIGTTITAIMGSLVANVNGKRSAVAHLFFKCAAALVCLMALPLFIDVLEAFTASVPQQIALSHFLLNLLIVILFIGILRPVARLVERIVPGEDVALPLWPEYLDDRCLTNPLDALACAKAELQREIMLARRMFSETLLLFHHYDKAKRRDITYLEMIVDNLQAEITRYLWSISCGQLTQSLSRRLFAYAAIVYDIERMADHALNIVEISDTKWKRKVAFSRDGEAELAELETLVSQNLADAASLMEARDGNLISRVKIRSAEVRFKVRQSTSRHLDRFYHRVCTAEAGPLFVDTLINLERLSDHCENIASYIEDLD